MPLFRNIHRKRVRSFEGSKHTILKKKKLFLKGLELILFYPQALMFMMKSAQIATVFVFFRNDLRGASGSLFPLETHSFVTSFPFCLVCECEKCHK